MIIITGRTVHSLAMQIDAAVGYKAVGAGNDDDEEEDDNE